MLKCMCGDTRKDRIRKEVICKNIEVVSTEDKLNGLDTTQAKKYTCMKERFDTCRSNAKGQGRLKMIWDERASKNSVSQYLLASITLNQPK